MNKIYLLRHGESLWNKTGKVQGQKDINLSKKGICQADKIGFTLADKKIDYIYSSDLIRAYKTAKIIGGRLNLEAKKLKSLREINFGPWEGLTLSEIRTKYYKDYFIWRNNPHKFLLPGAETLLDVQNRMLKALNNIRKVHMKSNILIVSHGTAIKTLILGILGSDLSNYGKLTISNGSLSIIEYGKYGPIIRVLNDTKYIKEV
ncbi:histidine phosphatase family protein [Thermohalobacter berrensis]|uniref:Phosphoglycerate mutase n=1 Tax=Thermohalobacter berrensis TaxID=99594 RepID=A0A419TAL6_9FIRM|nr:histidine phosphatase family protein [Thermohalobacter berrensis]RKD34526.1 phosphoglycerate mutase [Thermohalobacter berrensis]